MKKTGLLDVLSGKVDLVKDRSLRKRSWGTSGSKWPADHLVCVLESVQNECKAVGSDLDI